MPIVKEYARRIDLVGTINQMVDTQIGVLAETEDTQKRPAARYKAYETTVTLYGSTLPAIVIHSSAHDKRRHKKNRAPVEQE